MYGLVTVVIMMKRETIKMKLCVDSREKYKINSFRQYINSGASDIIKGIDIVTLKAGDAGTPDLELGWERKAEDFIPSIYNGQLDKQLKELSDNYNHPYLFIEYEGIMDLIEHNPNTNPEVIIGKVASILARHKVTVCFVGQFYIPLVCRTVDKFYDLHNPTKHYNPIRKGTTTRRKASVGEVKLDIISRLPKVGAKKGNKLLEKFDNSIQKISNATVEELMEVKGIGDKMAKNIKEILK